WLEQLRAGRPRGQLLLARCGPQPVPAYLDIGRRGTVLPGLSAAVHRLVARAPALPCVALAASGSVVGVSVAGGVAEPCCAHDGLLPAARTLLGTGRWRAVVPVDGGPWRCAARASAGVARTGAAGGRRGAGADAALA